MAKASIKSIASAFALLSTLCSCMTSGPPDVELPAIRAHLPYVESVDFPATISAGQTFNVTFRLSAAGKPEILGAGIGTISSGNQKITESVTTPIVQDTLLSPSPLDVLAAPYFAVLDSYGPPAQEFPVEYPALTAGEHQVYVLSADSRAKGGLLLDELVSSSYPSDNLPPGVAYQTYTITVQPAP